jgi:DNA-binding XRE family transcriptional regulator
VAAVNQGKIKTCLDPDGLRAFRKRRGLSQSKAAAALGIPLGTLISLEHGKAPQSALWGPLGLLMMYIELHGLPHPRIGGGVSA